MKKWYRFEILYKKVNPFSFEKKSKIYTNLQIAYSDNLIDAQQNAIKSFEVERFGDKLISIRCISE
jgi:hypothetical protein